jgi:hypothetical protein
VVNNNEESWFRHIIIKTIIGLTIAGGTAWGMYVNSKINQIDDLKTDVAVIKTIVLDIQRDLHARH